jgi:dCTP diphosphatase
MNSDLRQAGDRRADMIESIPRMAGELPTDELQGRLREFASAREWDKFHTPKNLAMALAGESGELLELFQWQTPEESVQFGRDPVNRSRVGAELADILIYALRMADVLGVDLAAAVSDKIDLNEIRYPIEQARGSARKYSDMSDEVKT